MLTLIVDSDHSMYNNISERINAIFFLLLVKIRLVFFFYYNFLVSLVSGEKANSSLIFKKTLLWYLFPCCAEDCTCFRSPTSIGLASDFPDVNNRSGMCKPPDNTDYPHQERGVRNQANPALHSVLLKHSFYFRYHQQLFVYPTPAQNFLSEIICHLLK